MRTTLLFLFSWLTFMGLYAQPPGPMGEPEPPYPIRPESRQDMHQEKVAFINSQVNFTEAEAVQFWPLYDKYRLQMDESHRLIMNRRRAPMNSEQDYQDALDLINSMIDLQTLYTKEFNAKLATFLPPSKIFRFYEAENNFKRHLIKKIEGGKHKK